MSSRPSANDDGAPHEWVSFEADDGTTYVLDVTFLASNWTCVFGRGCQGVLDGPAPELEQGCCSYGAHFTGPEDVRRVKRMARRLGPDEWQFRAEARRRGGPVTADSDGAPVSELVEDACIFLNRPGFAGGSGCALHLGAERRGERPLDWKPDVCWQLPLRLEEHVDDNGHRTATLREWKRRDWGPGGAGFHWWCTDDPFAFQGAAPVYVTLHEELTALLGDAIYRRLARYLASRGSEQLLPHPAARRRRSRDRRG